MASGCQSRQLSWVGAQNSSRPTTKQLESADKNVKQAKSPTAIAKNATTPQRSANLAATQAAQSESVQLASADATPDSGDKPNPTQQAIYQAGMAAAAASQVVPAQYATKPKYAPIGRSSGSENIPRVPMGTQVMSMPTTGPSTAQPSISNAGHVRPHAHSHADGKCNCGGSGVYKPVFPRFSGNSGCLSCGTASCSGECGNVMIEQGFAVPRTSDAQEYIFDGGDHDPKVRLREDLSQVGLDAEDTVIQYETADGKINVESGCRVAIYAPRFASVRKRQSTQERELAMRPQAALRPDGPGVVRDQLPSINVSKQVKSSNSDNVRVVEAFRDRRRVLPAERVLPVITVSDAFKPYEDLSLIRNGDFRQTDLAKLAKSAAAARSWTNVDELNVIIDGQEAVDITGAKKAADVTLYEFKGARIRLCKVASDQMANPGDVISFTIRFDNVGEQPLKSLVVTDSLAPRLEYVEKSQQSSVATDFSVTPNSAGSSVLRWEIQDGLKPGDGGLVRFSCKVR
jgi:uncharacterized repeat protein (TIGR01451 family)